MIPTTLMNLKNLSNVNCEEKVIDRFNAQFKMSNVNLTHNRKYC
uniref:Uncharacterized protein n=1 Tax=Anguilla anguilla TaxID=7936 RepID=A0A0E9XH55_ANGAN